MPTLIIKTILVVWIIASTGCAADQMKPILDDIQHCKRDYTFSLSSGTVGVGGNGAVTGNIHCDPYPPAAAPVTAPVVTP